MPKVSVWGRRIGEHMAIVVSLSISIKPVDGGLHQAVVSGAEDSILALGNTPEEAEREAETMFLHRIDYALENREELTAATEGVQYVIGPLSAGEPAREESGWPSVPVPPAPWKDTPLEAMLA